MQRLYETFAIQRELLLQILQIDLFHTGRNFEKSFIYSMTVDAEKFENVPKTTTGEVPVVGLFFQFRPIGFCVVFIEIARSTEPAFFCR
uniref:Uncharacterized protein n=1 Tax=Romanomermis culicivorax TaxID=13658 RepID=A0A915IR40_ROMCU